MIRLCFEQRRTPLGNNASVESQQVKLVDQLKHRTEFLFAHWAVPALKDLRGPKWHALVARIAGLPSTHPESLALALTMVRINGCINCDARRYRERGGCGNCSQFMLRTMNREDEASLLARYRTALKEITQSTLVNSLEKKAA